MEIKIQKIEQIAEAAKTFIEHIGTHHVFALYGEMGVGKTTFVKAVCEAMGVTDVINSPTFSIVNEYIAEPSGNRIFHFDFYRINKIEEAYDFGYEEYFYSHSLCFIEWPELIEELLPEDALKVTLSKNENEERTITF